MPRSRTLHGAAPDSSQAALLVMDLISDFEFKDGERLFKKALPLGRRIAALKNRAKAAGIPTIYVNDNRGRWRSDRNELIAHCLSNQSKAHRLVEQIVPEPADYFILKPKHSGFFGTPLHALLENIGARTLILAGVTSHQCILFTAADAYVREFDLIIPSDCIAAIDAAHTRAALSIFRTALKADTSVSAKVRLPANKRRTAGR
jgi:nicotinamidase-related amidase